MRRYTINEIPKEQVAHFKKPDWRMIVRYAKDRKTVIEVFFATKTKRGPGGFRYSIDLWTPTALRQIAKMAEESGITRSNEY